VNDQTMDKLLARTSSFNHKNRTVIGLRCWADSGTYPLNKIISKLFLVRNYNFAGTCLFSYSSMTSNKYWSDLTIDCFEEDASPTPIPNTTQNMIFGYVTNPDSLSIANATIKVSETGVETNTDINGFYAFTNLPEGVFSIDAESDAINTRIDSLSVSSLNPVIRKDIMIRPETTVTLTKTTPLDTMSVVLNANPQDKPQEDTSEINSQAQDFAIFTISDTIGIVIIIRNPIEQVISWSIMDMNGKVLISKRRTYAPGEVVESWNGSTVEGSALKGGIYNIVAVAEKNGEQITKTIVLTRKTN
jgi:hypothetical protein